MNAGVAWGDSDATTSIPCTVVGFPAYFCSVGDPRSAPQVSAAGTGGLSGAGFTGGIQAGYNWQSGGFVYGLEADFGAFDIGASRQVTQAYAVFPTGTFTIANAVDTDWLFTARARLGWSVSNILIYATGGLAVTNVKATNSFADITVPFGTVAGTWSHSATRAGWALGVGAEWALARNWTIKAEYLYLDFGSVTASGLVTGGGGYSHAISTTVDVAAHIARAGVNFRF